MPEPMRVEVVEGRSVGIAWSDGVETLNTSSELRAACQCATCRERPPDERTPAFHVAATIAEASLVGGYALNFVFAPDGHSTGIYPYTQLRAMTQRGPTPDPSK